jgi:tRNA pseudouridine13 synthase
MLALEALFTSCTEPLPRTAPAAGTGGTLKGTPEDFVVEEIPAYTPSGTGEHLFVWLQKRDMPALDLTQHLAQTLNVSPADIGTAGLKDAKAVTRQYVSVPRAAEAHLTHLESDPRVRVLGATLHGNKLKTGHLKGNRFDIVVRDVREGALVAAQETCAWLAHHGMPNFFGAQRFGRQGRTARDGARLLELMPGRAPRLGRSARRLALSALQSAVFNAYLIERLSMGALYRALWGDVMEVRASRGPFVCQDAHRETARMQAGEVVPTGPMLGPNMRRAEEEAAVLEERVLKVYGIEASQFAGMGKLMLGARRPLLVWPQDLHVGAAGPGALQLSFSLPPGSYATGVLHEIIGATAACPLPPGPG